MVPERRTAILVLLVGLCLMAAPGAGRAIGNGDTVFDCDTGLEISNFTGNDGALVTVELGSADVTCSTPFPLDGESYVAPPDLSGGNYSIRSLDVTPALDCIVAGESVHLDGAISMIEGGAHTFPLDNDLQFYTDLEKPCWNYTLTINGYSSEAPRIVCARSLTIDGFDLCYMAGNDVLLQIDLDGVASVASINQSRILLRIRQSDGEGACVNGSAYTLYFTSSEPSSPGTSDAFIPLSSGWNFVSTPKTLAAGSDTAAIFAGVDTAGHSILRYDTLTGAWAALKPTDPVRPLEGYWIYAATVTEIPLTYATASPQAPATRTLTTGWNAIGFSDTEPAAARDTLVTLGSAWSVLMGFDAATQSYETSIIRGGSGDHSDAGWMLPTKGYWLYMTGNGTLAAIGA